MNAGSLIFAQIARDVSTSNIALIAVTLAIKNEIAKNIQTQLGHTGSILTGSLPLNLTWNPKICRCPDFTCWLIQRYPH